MPWLSLTTYISWVWRRWNGFVSCFWSTTRTSSYQGAVFWCTAKGCYMCTSRELYQLCGFFGICPKKNPSKLRWPEVFPPFHPMANCHSLLCLVIALHHPKMNLSLCQGRWSAELSSTWTLLSGRGVHVIPFSAKCDHFFGKKETFLVTGRLQVTRASSVLAKWTITNKKAHGN